MVFSSNIFLFLLFPVTLMLYYLVVLVIKPLKPMGNVLLFILSLLFYAWGEPRFVFVMVLSIAVNYVSALLIDSCKSKRFRTTLLILSVAANLSILVYYKYANFFLRNVNQLFHTAFPPFAIALPIGISFFTFQAMSYVIDVYRKTVAVQKNPLIIGLYISFFPQLIAGPIVRYSTIENQVYHRTHTWAKLSDGVHRFIIGLGKKVILANNMALVADAAFAAPGDERGVVFSWLGAIAYSLQIYFDFSGYSDMAIGLGKMFGFTFLENFNLPYVSKTVSEFWRRWHLSLGQWFRDYVYFPMGGSRTKRKSRLVFNLSVVWLLTGFWHGANWTFVLWGMLHFAFIAAEKLGGLETALQNRRLPRNLYRAVTLLAVMLGWILFRAESVQAAGRYILSLFGANSAVFLSAEAVYYLREFGVLFLAALLCSTAIPGKVKAGLSRFSAMAVPIQLVTAAGLVFIFFWSLSFIEMGAHNPFIYFNF